MSAIDIIWKRPIETGFILLTIYLMGKLSYNMAFKSENDGFANQNDNLPPSYLDLGSGNVWVDGVGVMHYTQVTSGQDVLYKEFGISFDHFETAETYYKKLKEELVVGFNGTEEDDSQHMYTVLLTIILPLNSFFWGVLVSFLSVQNENFRKSRDNPLQTSVSLLKASLYDILFTLLPILAAWACHEHVLSLHLLLLGLILLIQMVHKASGKDKKMPIISNWILPGGSNPHHGIYSIETSVETTYSCTKCRSERKK